MKFTCKNCTFDTDEVDAFALHDCNKHSTTTPPVNESMEELRKEVESLVDVHHAKGWSTNETTNKIMYYIGKYNRTLLSTARQEAKAERTEEIRKAIEIIRGNFVYSPVDDSDYQKAWAEGRAWGIDNFVKAFIDSLTSKGGI